MKASAENRRISMILKMVREHTLVPQPDFQRRSVWTNPDKIAFIETILEGYPFPEIYIASNSVDVISGDATEMLVDGQQRVGTIEAYFKGDKPFKTKALKKIPRWEDLGREQKEKFLNYEVAVRNLGLLDEPLIREIFKRMNRTSYNLNDMERYNAVYLGKMKKFSERVAGLPFFARHKMFSPNDIRRMKDISYVASLTATILSTYFNRDEEIEDYLSNYNEEFSSELDVGGRFSAAFDYIESLDFDEGSRAWRKVDFYTLFVEVDRQLSKKSNKPEVQSAASALKKLFSEVDSYRDLRDPALAVTRYVQASLRNTSDRGQRMERGAVVQSILEGVEGEAYSPPALTSDSPYLAASPDEDAFETEGDNPVTSETAPGSVT